MVLNFCNTGISVPAAEGVSGNWSLPLKLKYQNSLSWNSCQFSRPPPTPTASPLPSAFAMPFCFIAHLLNISLWFSFFLKAPLCDKHWILTAPPLQFSKSYGLPKRGYKSVLGEMLAPMTRKAPQMTCARWHLTAVTSEVQQSPSCRKKGGPPGLGTLVVQ